MVFLPPTEEKHTHALYHLLVLEFEAPIPILFELAKKVRDEGYEWLDAKITVTNTYHLDKDAKVKQVQQYGRLVLTFAVDTMKDVIDLVMFAKRICPYEVCRVYDKHREVR